MVAGLPSGGVLLFENTRFHKEETSKDVTEREAMAKTLAGYGDVYVNDAFGTAHRPHASPKRLHTISLRLPVFSWRRRLSFLMKRC